MNQFSALFDTLRRRCPALELREFEPMCAHTSFHIGGPARLMALPRTEQEAAEAVCAASELGVAPVYMGNGSNLLVSDGGVEAFVVKASDGLGEITCTEETVIRASSGVLLSRLANFALSRSLTGLEFAHGIPGSLGGAVTMNAGAYGGETCQVVFRTEYLTETGRREVLEGEAHDFAYRHSSFSGGTRLILNASLRLQLGDPETIRAQMAALSEKRKSKQPLEFPSAGSTFKRPEGYFAAALIEDCGLKGLQIGGALVSDKHAGFVVNRGDATCADVLRLVERIRETVLRQTGVTLELEVKTLGLSHERES